MNKVILLVQPAEVVGKLFEKAEAWVFTDNPPTSGRGKRVLVYAGPPVNGVVGEAVLEGVVTSSVDSLIPATSAQSQAHQIRELFAGKTTGSAIRLKSLRKYMEPIPLQRIREAAPNFTPPKSFIYIWDNDERYAALLELASKLSAQVDRHLESRRS